MAKLIQCNVPSDNMRRSRVFYRTLFQDQDFARSLTDDIEAYHQPISSDGIQLTISPRQVPEEQITCHFAVDNIDETLTALERAGGTVVAEPFALRVSADAFNGYEQQVRQFHPEVGQPTADIGRSAIVRDPDGNYIGITELREQAHWLFKYGRYASQLEPDQVAQHQRGLILAKQLKPISS